jgi:hypothetical protein
MHLQELAREDSEAVLTKLSEQDCKEGRPRSGKQSLEWGRTER